MPSSGFIQGRLQLCLPPGGWTGNEKLDKVSSRCSAASAEALVLSLNVKHLYERKYLQLLPNLFIFGKELVLRREHGFLSRTPNDSLFYFSQQ